MNAKIVLDPSLRAKLNGLDSEFEVCDETGRTLGHFLPEEVYRELLYTWAKAQVTDEEIAQARHELRTEGGLTTPEAIAYLENRARDMKGGHE